MHTRGQDGIEAKWSCIYTCKQHGTYIGSPLLAYQRLRATLQIQIPVRKCSNGSCRERCSWSPQHQSAAWSDEPDFSINTVSLFFTVKIWHAHTWNIDDVTVGDPKYMCVHTYISRRKDHWEGATRSFCGSFQHISQWYI